MPINQPQGVREQNNFGILIFIIDVTYKLKITNIGVTWGDTSWNAPAVLLKSHKKTLWDILGLSYLEGARGYFKRF